MSDDNNGVGLNLAEQMQPELVELDAPEDCTGLSIRGLAFEVPPDGIVKAPADIAAELVAHGFKVRELKKAVKAARTRVKPPED